MVNKVRRSTIADVILIGQGDYSLKLPVQVTSRQCVRGASKSLLGSYVTGLLAHNGGRVSSQGYAVEVACLHQNKMKPGYLHVDSYVNPKRAHLRLEKFGDGWKPITAAAFLVAFLQEWWTPVQDDLQAKLTPTMIINLIREVLKTVPAEKGVYLDWEDVGANFLPYLEGRSYDVPTLPQTTLVQARCLDGSLFYATPKGPRLTWDAVAEQEPLPVPLAALRDMPIDGMARA